MNAPRRPALRFGVFELDLDRRELRKEGVPCRLQDQPLELLIALLARPGDLVTREELRAQLWRDGTHVEFDDGVNAAVARLRSVLGDSAESPRFIQTFPRRGYRFIAPVAADGVPAATGASARFRLRTPRGEIDLAEGENVIGRDDDCHVCLPADRVSRRHARIVVSGGRAVLEDLGSKNGTRLRGARLAAPVDLVDGDEILVGHELLVFVAARPSSVTRTDRTSTAGG